MITDKRKVKYESRRRINTCVCIERRYLEKTRKYGLNVSLILNNELSKIFDKKKVGAANE